MASRPIPTGRTDSLGRDIRVSEGSAVRQPTAPPPPADAEVVETTYARQRRLHQEQRARNIERGDKVLTAWQYREGPAPTAGQIIRAAAVRGWAGHSRSLRQVTAGTLTSSHTGANIPRTRRVGHERIEEPNGITRFEGGTVEHLDIDGAVALSHRYRAFVEYMTETRHDWEAVRLMSYADNSDEVEERSRLTGETRTRTLMGGGSTSYSHKFSIVDGKVVER